MYSFRILIASYRHFSDLSESRLIIGFYKRGRRAWAVANECHLVVKISPFEIGVSGMTIAA